MRVSQVLPVLLFSVAALAGCADVEQGPSESTNALFNEAGLVSSHPNFNLLTNDALLEAPEPGMLFEDVDGQRVWYKPAYRGLPGAISELGHTFQTPDVEGGGRGIAVFGSLVFAGPNAGPMSIIDISDPAATKVIAKSPDTPVRDADTILYPDGRLIVITTQGGANIVATDVTDPYTPAVVSNIDTPNGNHNIAVVPGSSIVYNTDMDIIDYADPANPIVTGTFDGGNGCHDIAFHIDQTAGKIWALCAGYAQTEIWDIADPFTPVLLVAIDYPTAEQGVPLVGDQVPSLPAGNEYPVFPGSFSHLAIVNHDASVLIMGDETGGGGRNGCDFYAEGPDGQTYSGPSGNLWFYDITDPENPVLKGHVSPAAQDAEGSCTAHFGHVIEDTNHVVMAFYTAGIVLVDFNNLDNPRIVDRLDQEGNIWDVQFHQGYLFTGDMVRGVDVLNLS